MTGALQSSDSQIAHGIGRGLWINPHGNNPGYALGTSEPELQQTLSRLLAPRMTFYDIGANVGFFTVIGAQLVGPGGKVYAFDPVPSNAEALRHNLVLNRMNHAEVVEVAVSSAPGRSQLRVAGETVLAHLVDVSSTRTEDGDIEVQVTTLDHEVANGRKPPDVIKMDIEGAEIKALEGMGQTLETFRPTLIVELHGTGDAFATFFRDRGYEIRRLGEARSITQFSGLYEHVVAAPVGG